VEKTPPAVDAGSAQPLDAGGAPGLERAPSKRRHNGDGDGSSAALGGSAATQAASTGSTRRESDRKRPKQAAGGQTRRPRAAKPRQAADASQGDKPDYSYESAHETESDDNLDETRVPQGDEESAGKNRGGRGKARCATPACSNFPEWDGSETKLCRVHGGGLKGKCEAQGCNRAIADSEKFCLNHGGKGWDRQSCLADNCASFVKFGSIKPFCIIHGEGRRCKAEGCTKLSQWDGERDLYCVQHGGGRKCLKENCTRLTQGGGKPFCVAHGGGKRCHYPNCPKAAAKGGDLPFCKAHGGGKRCLKEGCDKSAATGGTQFCKLHGGGRRCLHEGCDKACLAGGIQACTTHGGGRRCLTGGCNRLAAPGQPKLCRIHGGGRTCAVEKCTERVTHKAGALVCLAHEAESSGSPAASARRQPPTAAATSASATTAVAGSAKQAIRIAKAQAKVCSVLNCTRPVSRNHKTRCVRHVEAK